MIHGAPAEQVWLNGKVRALHEARVSVLDRGFLFGDGVYELVRVFDRIGVGMELHQRRLERSLQLARIDGFDAGELPTICEALLDANGIDNGTVYLQVTRGAAPQRSHVPPAGLQPTVLALASSAPSLAELMGPDRVRIVLLPDERWLRCEIKTISLLGNVLAAMRAAELGADEPVLHRDGILSEGGSTNVFLRRGERLITPGTEDGPPILHGVTRAMVIDAARSEGVEVDERRVRIEELVDADEVMITSSRRLLSIVAEIDGVPTRSAARLQTASATGSLGDAPIAVDSDAWAPRLFELLRPRLHSAK